MPLEKMIWAVSLALGVIVSKKETFSDVLKRFEQKLPEKPDWIVLSSVDGLIVGAVNVDLTEEERSPTVPMIVLRSICERVNDILMLGHLNFSISAGSRGFVLVTPIYDEYLLGMQFRKGTSYTSLASIGNSLTTALAELLTKLKD